MSEQLYRIEWRIPKVGDVLIQRYEARGDETLEHNILVPVPEVHDIKWAWEKMAGGKEMLHRGERCKVDGSMLLIRNPYTECWEEAKLHAGWLDDWSEPAPSPQPVNLVCKTCGREVQIDIPEAYCDATEIYCSTTCRDAGKSPQPGSMEWAREYVASGGAVWVEGSPLTRYTEDTCTHPSGSTFPHFSRDWGRESGWHPWGDRAWLRALPDGTRVRGPHTASVYVKMGNGLRHEHNPHDLRPILFDEINSIGWDLVREPVMDAVASATECDSDDMLTSRIDTLESDVKILAARMARLERGQ